MSQFFDLAIVGGGPAGYSAAFEAVKYGMKVAIFERDLLGGTCLNRGCIPTKYLSHVARVYYEANSKFHSEICYQGLEFDYKKSFVKRSTVILNQREELIQELKNSGVELVNGDVSVQEGSITLDGTAFGARSILIATGSQPAVSPVKDSISSDELLKLDNLPARIQILGGGVSAVEFAEIFQMLGCDITLNIRADRILRKWDREVAISLGQSMKKKGIRIKKNCDFNSMAFNANDVVVSMLGRVPVIPQCSDGLIEIGSKGGLLVDENGMTKTKGVYAAGDVLDNSAQLAHVAMVQGRRVVHHIMGENTKPLGAFPKCIYIDQEVATVGITEEENNIISAKQSMYSNARTRISIVERGFIKVYADKISHIIVGATLMCERAGDIITEFTTAIDEHLTCENMLDILRPHPSYDEAITDLLRVLKNKLET